MDHISGFLSRYLSPYLKHYHAKESAARVCSDVLGVEILPEHITLKGITCVVAGNHVLKHRIFLKQEEIKQGFAKDPLMSRIQSIM